MNIIFSKMPCVKELEDTTSRSWKSRLDWMSESIQFIIYMPLF